jgi:hypothetical protein
MKNYLITNEIFEEYGSISKKIEVFNYQVLSKYSQLTDCPVFLLKLLLKILPKAFINYYLFYYFKNLNHFPGFIVYFKRNLVIQVVEIENLKSNAEELKNALIAIGILLLPE